MAGQSSQVKPIRYDPPYGSPCQWQQAHAVPASGVKRQGRVGVHTVPKAWQSRGWGRGIHKKRPPGALGVPERGALGMLQSWYSFDLLLRLPSVGFAVWGGGGGVREKCMS